jgi:hypothetical protein
MSINAFIDDGYTPGKEFCEKFLSSNEFTLTTLQLILSGTSQLKKPDAVRRISDGLESLRLTPEDVLLAYVKQQRTWLSLKLGKYDITPNTRASASLLKEFGEDSWYGPIQEPNQPSKKWYIRTHKIPHYVIRRTKTTSTLDQLNIRWSVIAEVGQDYVALSWNGFSYSPQTTEEQNTQFPFWKYIPDFFEELAIECQAQWEHPNLHKLVLDDMWDKYLNTTSYKWRHLRIRAEASGLAINAHSAGVEEIDARGLQALSQELSRTVLETLGLANDSEKIINTENVILLTLIKKWGTKSYEFQLDRKLTLGEIETEKPKKDNLKCIFKAHCYFGLKPYSKTQDSLQHLRCFLGYYGGSTAVLEFLLTELGRQG